MGWADNASEGLKVATEVVSFLRDAKLLDAQTAATISNLVGSARGAWIEARAKYVAAGGSATDFTGNEIADRALLQARGVAAAIEDSFGIEDLWPILEAAAKLGMKVLLA